MIYLNALAWHVRGLIEGRYEAFLGLTLMLAGLACIWSFFYQLWIRQWPSVRGEWLQAELNELGGSGPVLSQREFIIDTRYRYTVSGKRFAGQRFSPWVVVTSYNLKSILEYQLKRVADADELRVFYNPNRPSKSFLIKPGVAGLIFTVLLALLFLNAPMLVFQQFG